MDGIPIQEVRDHLERVVADDLFANASRLCRFLRFTVESKLSGREQQVKEYVIGREVFDRKDDYDPRLDPIVRVEARRLRAKLTEYYKGPGRADTVRLEYPRGTYVPVVARPPAAPPASAASPVSPPATGLRLPRLLIGTAIVLAVVPLVWFHPWVSRSPQTIAVLPVRWLSNAAGLDEADAGIAEAVSAELANREVAPVIAWPVLLGYQNKHFFSDEIASDVGASTILLVSVRDIDRQKLVSVFLMDTGSKDKRRAESYVRPDLSTLASQRAIAHQIVGDLTPALREAH
jgi:TolB-like protein